MSSKKFKLQESNQQPISTSQILSGPYNMSTIKLVCRQVVVKPRHDTLSPWNLLPGSFILLNSAKGNLTLHPRITYSPSLMGDRRTLQLSKISSTLWNLTI